MQERGNTFQGQKKQVHVIDVVFIEYFKFQQSKLKDGGCHGETILMTLLEICRTSMDLRWVTVNRSDNGNMRGKQPSVESI